VVGRVFVDFGRGRLYALPEDGQEVVVLGGFLEMFDRLRPRVVVADSYPRKLQPTITRLGGATYLRLRDLKKLSEERRNNGLRKTDEDDVKVLRQIFYEAPGLFQPLYASSLELEVRSLTELWVEMAGIKKMVKHTRTVTASPLAAEAHKVLQRYADRLTTRIHEKVMELPLYSMAVERLGLKGGDTSIYHLPRHHPLQNIV
jgi:glutamyl-tRNA reductase